MCIRPRWLEPLAIIHTCILIHLCIMLVCLCTVCMHVHTHNAYIHVHTYSDTYIGYIHVHTYSDTYIAYIHVNTYSAYIQCIHTRTSRGCGGQCAVQVAGAGACWGVKKRKREGEVICTVCITTLQQPPRVRNFF